jgi:hypothetical protein
MWHLRFLNPYYIKNIGYRSVKFYFAIVYQQELVLKFHYHLVDLRGSVNNVSEIISFAMARYKQIILSLLEGYAGFLHLKSNLVTMSVSTFEWKRQPILLNSLAQFIQNSV